MADNDDNDSDIEAAFYRVIDRWEAEVLESLRKDAQISGRPIDRRLLDARLETFRQEHLQSPTIRHERELRELLISELTERLRNKIR